MRRYLKRLYLRWLARLYQNDPLAYHRIWWDLLGTDWLIKTHMHDELVVKHVMRYKSLHHLRVSLEQACVSLGKLQPFREIVSMATTPVSLYHYLGHHADRDTEWTGVIQAWHSLLTIRQTQQTAHPQKWQDAFWRHSVVYETLLNDTHRDLTLIAESLAHDTPPPLVGGSSSG